MAPAVENAVDAPRIQSASTTMNSEERVGLRIP